MPGQQQDTQMISESPMTHVSDPFANQTRINSGMEPPLQQLDEEAEENAIQATLSNDDRVQEPANGSEIRMETNSNQPISASASAAEEMLEH